MIKAENLLASQGGPIILAQISTCNGWYYDQFYPSNPNTHKIWTENWTGWFNEWGGGDPHRTAEDVAFAVARFFQYGGTVQNYYMVTIYNLNGERACFFGNANETDNMTITFEGNKYTVPAWSVSILPECQTVVYNTAQVNRQTSIMLKKPNEADEGPLQWPWRLENLESLKSQLLKKKSES
ncbi:unnamed protein product [Ilex paraguariensis]|uniref:Beta-galactosidase beta-sandwich domain-containing protein n=1 Tax=Ilex paraguariensis TaxID=185542 RepID=A0ABC8RMH9_9AQUA